MPQAEPEPLRLEPRAATEVPTPRRSGRRALAYGVLGGGVAAAIGFRLLASGWIGAPRPDMVPTDEVARRIQALATLGPIRLARVAVEEAEPALRSMGLPDADHLQMQQDIIAERVRLAWLLLYDSDVEDGDAVEVESGGLKTSLVLTAKPVRIAIPMPPDGRIRLTGTVDGAGGGVTVGVVTQNGPFGLPPMRVGQIVSLPVFAA